MLVYAFLPRGRVLFFAWHFYLWNNVKNASGYNIYWASAAGVSKDTGRKIPAVTSPYTHTGLTNGLTYYYVITSYNQDEESIESVEVNATPQVDRSKFEGDNVFGWVDGSKPGMPVWNSSTGGFTVQSGDTREQVTIDENFRLNAGDQAVFENKIVRVKPNNRQDIEIYGSLIILNSLFLWDQTEHQQTRLTIKDGGSLTIENSYAFSHNQYWVNWDFENGSGIYYDNFVGDPWCATAGSIIYRAKNFSTVKLTFDHASINTSVNIEDAHHIWFEIFPPQGGGSQVEISPPEKRKWGDWNIDSMWPGTTVHVKNSYLFEIDISLGNDTHVTVKDALSGFSLGWGIGHNGPDFINCQLADLGDPGNNNGVYYENQTWNLPCNNSSLTVINSVLQAVWPVNWGCVNLKVYRSNLVDPRVFHGPATYEIYDSTVFHAAAYRGGKIYLENVEILEDIEVKDTGSFIYGYNVTGDFQVIEVDGGQYIELAAPGVPW